MAYAEKIESCPQCGCSNKSWIFDWQKCKRCEAMTPVEEAARAHSNLNAFAAIIALIEGGIFYGGETERATGQIAAICKREQARWLAKYDAAVAKVSP